MKAAICRSFDAPLTIEDVTLAPPQKYEVRVKLKACAICHSDIIFAEGGWGGDLPAIYGHEAAGIVAEIGEGVETVKIGDHVVATLIRACGACPHCGRGQEVICEETFPLDDQSPIKDRDGTSLTHGMRIGAFAEEVTVHQSQVVAIDKDIPLDAASLLACGVITGYGAVTNTADMPAGAHAVIIGCGGVGLNTVQGAAHRGGASVIAIDLADDKLEAAKSFGATHIINPSREDAAARIAEITAGKGADYVFITVGVKQALDGADQYLGRGGTVVVVGIPPSGVDAIYDPATLASWSQKILGSKMGSSIIRDDVPALAALYKEGKLKLDELITGRFTLEEINEAIASTKAGKALRNVIVFD